MTEKTGIKEKIKMVIIFATAFAILYFSCFSDFIYKIP